MSALSHSAEKIKRKTTRRNSPLLFPAHLARRFLRKGKYAHRIRRKAGVSLAAVIQYLTIELLGLSGQIAVKLGAKRISPRHIFLAMHLDDEFKELCSHIIMAQGGTMPMIPGHPF